MACLSDVDVSAFLAGELAAGDLHRVTRHLLSGCPECRSRLVAAEILDAAGIPHALIGALALSAYGVNRASLDLLAVDPACLRPDLWADLQSRGIARRAPRVLAVPFG